MASITWIKIKTDMFDDEKIKLIERMPEGDTILVIWVKLLAYAGKVNCNGYIMITEDIPMNIEEMAVIFNRPFEKVRYAIQVLQKYRMVEVDENKQVRITNWEKHQNIDGMEHVKKLNAERNKRYRERKKQKQLFLEENTLTIEETQNKISNELEVAEKWPHNDGQLTIEETQKNVTSCVTSRDGTDIDIDKDKDIDIYNTTSETDWVNEVVEHYKTLNNLPSFRSLTDKRKKAVKARIKEYGIDEIKNTLSQMNVTQFFIDSKSSNWFTFDWIFNPNNFIKVIEGKYFNKVQSFNNQNVQQQQPIYKEYVHDPNRGED